jgi:hypothetical protein
MDEPRLAAGLPPTGVPFDLYDGQLYYIPDGDTHSYSPEGRVLFDRYRVVQESNTYLNLTTTVGGPTPAGVC